MGDGRDRTARLWTIRWTRGLRFCQCRRAAWLAAALLAMPCAASAVPEVSFGPQAADSPVTVRLGGLAALYDPQEADLPVTLRLGGGVEFKPYYLTQLDQAGFTESAPGGQAAGLNLRRQQQGGELYFGGQANLGFVWDFGGSPGTRARLLEGQASYIGLKPVTVTVGVLKPQFSMESIENGADIFLMERASIVNVARNLAASSGREAVQVKGSGPRWLASAALTAGITGVSNDSGQRAVIGRVLGLPVQAGDLTVEVGASGQYVWRPANTTGAGSSVNLSNTVELAINAVPPSVSTGTLFARNAAVAGPEASAAWRSLLVQGEYYGINVSRAAGGPDLRFDGWYVQAAWTLLGAQRRWQSDSGVWEPTVPRDGFSPRDGRWGTVEAAARYSTVNLNAGDVHGGRQDAWTVGASYWPVLPLRLIAEYLHTDVTGGPSPRTVNAVAGRFQVQF